MNLWPLSSTRSLNSQTILQEILSSSIERWVQSLFHLAKFQEL